MGATKSVIIPLVGAVGILSACSGGGDGASAPTSPPTSPPPPTTSPPPPPPPAVTGMSVTIFSPIEGQQLAGGEIAVSGFAQNADQVTVALDDGPEVTATGTDSWSAVIDAAGAAVGGHAITARASGAEGETEKIVPFEIIAQGPQPTGVITEITYTSSVDGEELSAQLYLPSNLDSAAEGPVPLVIFLHGGGSIGSFPGVIRPDLEDRRWIGITPRGREWNVADRGCGWPFAAGYFNNPDPDVGPGEQDALDAISWVQSNYAVDPDRIYLMGFSMGGRGAYAIGMNIPDMFAAVAPFSPVSDTFEVWDRVQNDVPCFESIIGGAPGDSPRIDSAYKATSGRFMIENAYNIPVFHGHGLNDSLTFNIAPSEDYLHGWHMTVDDSWTDCHDDAMELCFGHTPTLSELRAAQPGGYDWAYMFTPVPHQIDSKWVQGTVPDPEDVGTTDPQDPTRLVGMMDFFDRRTRMRAPETVVFKTYDDTHEKAYWLRLASATPWLDLPAAVRATRDPASNLLEAELARVDTLYVDMELAQLSPAATLSLTLDELVEPAFDPALAMGASESLVSTIVLEGDFAAATGVDVTRDGEALSAALIALDSDRLALGPLQIDQPTNLEITVQN